METAILVIGAILIAWLVFTFLLKIVKTTIKTALLVAAIFLLLTFFGIGPNQVFELFGQWLGFGGDPQPTQSLAPIR